MAESEANSSAISTEPRRVHQLRKYLAQYATRSNPASKKELAEILLRFRVGVNEEWIADYVERFLTDLKKKRQDALEEFLNEELESGDLGVNLDKLDSLEAERKKEGEEGKEAWRPTKDVQADVEAHRAAKKQMYLMDLKRESAELDLKVEGLRAKIRSQEADILKRVGALEKTVEVSEDAREKNIAEPIYETMDRIKENS